IANRPPEWSRNGTAKTVSRWTEDSLTFTVNVLQLFVFRPAVVKRIETRRTVMKISERLSDDVLVIEPKERLTVETEPDFASYFIRLLEAGHRRFAISLADVPYIDSVGLGAIVRAYTSTRRR